MIAPQAAALPDRGLVAVVGPDRVAFLQGLLTCDVAAVDGGAARWGALLTPQGKYLHDVIALPFDGAVVLDCEGGRRDDLLRRLQGYTLRSDVEVVDVTAHYTVHALVGDGARAAAGLSDAVGATADFGGGLAVADPRHASLGVRLVLPRDGDGPSGFAAAGFSTWDRLRIRLGVPDGTRDLIPEKSILLENGFDELGGVAWDKGCYVGQELTARTKYRGLVKKRLVPVRFDGAAPPPGTPILSGGAEVGEMRSGLEGIGLALLRIEALTGGGSLAAGSTLLVPAPPEWLRL